MIDVRLHTPKCVPPKVKALRAGLEHRTVEWRARVRAEPQVARLMIRRLIQPLELCHPDAPGLQMPDFIKADTHAKPPLRDGIAEWGEMYLQELASPTGFEPVFWP